LVGATAATYGQVAYGQLAAFAILYTAPVVLLYSALSRVFSGAFSLTGAVKG
jgi:multiple sugar transport system permease protein